MDKHEAYLFLLNDTFFSNFVLSTNSEVAVYAMQVFGTYDKFLMFWVLVVGAMCAIIMNYVFGRVLYNLYKFSPDQVIHTKYHKLSNFFAKYGNYIMLLVVVQPFGRFVVLIAGFVRLGIVRTTIIAVAYKALYYCYTLYV